MSDNNEELREWLVGKTREELVLIAKRLAIQNPRKLTKEPLVTELLNDRNRGALGKILFPSWWSLHHNHVYGVLTFLALIWAIYAWRFPKPTVGPNDVAQSLKHAFAAPRQVGSQAHRVAGLPEADAASEARSFSSITLDEYFEKYFAEAATALQRDQLQRDLVGKTVVWSGSVSSVEPGERGAVKIVVRQLGKPDSLLSNAAFLEFDSSQRSELLPLRSGQAIRFTCVIRAFVVSPFLERCKLLPAV
jgi:hypothetical protein